MGRRLLLVAICGAGLILSGCGRNQAPLTPCLGADPAVPRIKDVAPPNCTPLLPGQPEAAA